MKFRFASVSLALFLAVLGAASFTRCGDDGGLAAAVDPGITAAQIANWSDDTCEALTCDGDFGDDVFPEAKGEGDGDVFAIMNILTAIFENAVDMDAVFNQLDEDGALPDIPAEETRVLSITGVTKIECGDGDDETPGDGTITVSNTFRAEFDSNYDTGDDSDSRTIVAFHNCLIEGELLNSGTQSIRFNGSITDIERERAAPVESDPIFSRITGTITTSQADDNGDTAGGEVFWEGPLSANGTGNFFDDAAPAGWDNNYFDGGICFGAAVALGTADDTAGNDTETTEDDECADDDGTYFLPLNLMPDGYFPYD